LTHEDQFSNVDFLANKLLGFLFLIETKRMFNLEFIDSFEALLLISEKS
jgi:hypothetical protein